MKKFNIAVMGATGLVGGKIIEILQERNFPVGDAWFYTSARSAGESIDFMGKTYVALELTEANLDKKIHIALFAVEAPISEHFAPILAKSGAVVIDNSSRWRMDADVPLVVPEVNPLDAGFHRGIIANPNCSSIQAAVALKPLHDAFVIKRVAYTTYQAASGAGLAGLEDLERGIKGHPPQKFPRPIAFNVIPQVDTFTENGYTGEEMKMINETRKILGEPELKITATCVRVPVRNGHSESINAEFKNTFYMEEISSVLKDAPGLTLTEEGMYPTPIDVSGSDDVYIGRLRRDFSAENAINMWVVADNLRKGAATNAVQIAELLIERGYMHDNF